jgi:uncharacterized protein DUF3551
MRVGLVIAAAAAAMLLPASAGAAIKQGPWCAVQSVGEDSGIWNCQMRTFEECRLEVVAGNRGNCTQNPNWPGWYDGTGDRLPSAGPVRKRRAR